MKRSGAIDHLNSTLTAEQAFQLLNRFQRGFPLQPRPFAALAAQLDCSETAVIDALRDLQARGVVTRVGAVFRPNVVGVSALAALKVPARRIEDVARYVSARPEVNHNYEREHQFNLWFVVTACDADCLRVVLEDIEDVCECGPALVLPMLQDYHIDLGFNLAASVGGRYGEILAAPAGFSLPAALTISTGERALIAALQDGLPLVERPFAALECDETEAIATLSRWTDTGVIKRFGVIVRHRELGFADNAMVVWDLPDGEVEEAGHRIAASGQVTLCYRRPRRLPQWPYNLFCMLHGRDRAEVEARVVTLAASCELGAYPRAVLFSRRRFKQRGAHYVTAAGVPKMEHGRA